MEDRDVNQKETHHGGAYSLRKDDKTCTQFRKKKNILSTDVNLCMSVCISEVVYIVFLPHIHK